MMFGRKFVGCVIATICILIVYFLAVFKAPAALDPYVTMGAIGSFTTIWFAYIGGNVWSKWARGKYFNKEILENEEK